MRGQDSGFALIDLLAVVLVLALLFALAGSGLAHTDGSAKGLRCLHNLRQLTVAWQMYPQDYHDRIIPVLHGSEAQGGAGDPILGSGWIEGWLDWTLSTDNTNTAFLTDKRYAKIAPYLRGATNVFKCPADVYLTPVQQSVGWNQRVRSYSASLALGAGNASTGPWDNLYRQIYSVSDFMFPSPAETFLYVDEHPDSLNDPGFYSPHQTALVDMPATYHNGCGAFSFADGHVELHKWTGCLTQPRAAEVLFNYNVDLGTTNAGDADIHWLSYHTQRTSAASY